jgi:hypothetical protein
MILFASLLFAEDQNLDAKENEQKCRGVGLHTHNEKKRSRTAQQEGDPTLVIDPELSVAVL